MWGLDWRVLELDLSSKFRQTRGGHRGRGVAFKVVLILKVSVVFWWSVTLRYVAAREVHSVDLVDIIMIIL